MSINRATEIPTIDCELVTIVTDDDTEIALDTADEIKVEPQIDTQEAVKLVVKGKLRAQKPERATITGNKITLSDNVFTPELVKILQGGTIKYWTSAEQTATQEDKTEFGIASYEPPVTGKGEKLKPFKLKAYSAQYDSAGLIVNHECITYPNCKGTPIALSAKDNEFRNIEYTVHSAPSKDEAPYKIDYLKELPKVQ